MNDTEKLLTSVQSTFKEIPKELSLSYELIDQKALIIPDSLFDHNTPPAEDDLLGKFTPLIVVPATNNNFTIIDGCKRFLKSKEDTQDKIACRIIQTPIDDIATGLLRIILNQNRPQHIREKFLFFTWLKTNYPAAEFKQKAAKLGFSSKAHKQFDLLSSSDTNTKEAFLNNFLDISLINSFLIFSKDGREAYLESFQKFSLSFQFQREFLEWLPETAYAKSTTIKDILDHAIIKDAIKSTTLNDPQKIQKIRSFLYTQKFPRLSDAQKKWKELSDKVNPGPGRVSFEHSPYFEKNRLEVKITLPNDEKAVDIFSKLAKISSETWKKLISPL